MIIHNFELENNIIFYYYYKYLVLNLHVKNEEKYSLDNPFIPIKTITVLKMFIY